MSKTSDLVWVGNGILLYLLVAWILKSRMDDEDEGE